MSAIDIFQPYVDFFHKAVDFALQKPLLFAFSSLLTISLTTIYITHNQSIFRIEDLRLQVKTIRRVPYWIPFVGSQVEFSAQSQAWLLAQARKRRAGVFALRLTGQDYIIIASPLLCDAISNSEAISAKAYDDLQIRRFIGHPQITNNVFDRINQAHVDCMTDHSRLQKLTQLLESNTYNFISPSRSWVDQAQWERTADVKPISETPTLAVSALITTLIRDFASHIIFSSMIGNSFLDANADFVTDFFNFSSKYSMFMTGLPYWIAPGLGPPALSREKCLRALDTLVTAIAQELDRSTLGGLGAGLLYDVDAVHPAIRELVRQARQDTTVGFRPRPIACEILEFLWRMIFQTVHSVIWTIIYLSMEGDEHKSALNSVQKELKDVVVIRKAPPNGLPFPDPPSMKFNLVSKYGRAIENQLPVLRATISEVQRLETQLEQYLTVEEDFVLARSSADDEKENQDGSLIAGMAEKYQMWEGDQIYVAYGAANKDSQYWDRPQRFVPSRFLARDEPAKGANAIAMSRGFGLEATEEIMLIVVALLSSFDFSSIEGDKGLNHPGTTFVAGVGVPKRDISVRVTRRPIA